MPIITGAEVLKILSRDSRYDAIHRVVWSTSGNHQYVSECLQNGAEKYFAKPTDMQQLDGIIIQLSAILQIAEADSPT